MKKLLFTPLFKRFIRLLRHWADYLDAWLSRLEQDVPSPQPLPLSEKLLVPPTHWLERTRHLDKTAWLGTGQTFAESVVATEPAEKLAPPKPLTAQAKQPMLARYQRQVIQPLQGFIKQTYSQLRVTLKAVSPHPLQTHDSAVVSAMLSTAELTEEAASTTPPRLPSRHQLVKKRAVMTSWQETTQALQRPQDIVDIIAAVGQSTYPPPLATTVSHPAAASITPPTVVAETAEPKANHATHRQAQIAAVTPNNLRDDATLLTGYPPSGWSPHASTTTSISRDKPVTTTDPVSVTDPWPSLPAKTVHGHEWLQVDNQWQEYQRLQALELEQRRPPWIV